MTQDTRALAIKREADALQTLLEPWKGFAVKSQSDAGLVHAELLKVKAKAKELKAQKEQVTKPLNAALTAARGWFKPLETVLDGLEEVFKGKLGQWDRDQRAEADRQLAAAAAAFQAQRPAEGLAIMQAVPDAPVKQQGTSVRTVWKFRITVPGNVPRELCNPDDRLIRAAVDAGRRDIAGVEIYEDSEVRVRV
jgi:hypothetical protein